MHASPQHLQLKSEAVSSASALAEVNAWLESQPEAGAIWLHCSDRGLNLPELRAIQARLACSGCWIERVVAAEALGLVAAAGLGLDTALEQADAALLNAPSQPDPLTIHRGTLRSGDHLEVEGSLLVLGDVNPGARVSAGGDVRVGAGCGVWPMPAQAATSRPGLWRCSCGPCSCALRAPWPVGQRIGHRLVSASRLC